MLPTAYLKDLLTRSDYRRGLRDGMLHSEHAKSEYRRGVVETQRQAASLVYRVAASLARTVPKDARHADFLRVAGDTLMGLAEAILAGQYE
jgi:hypothetical protein